MPIKIPNSLPARATLEGENIFVMTEYRAIHQDIRPLKLLILNLMPTKIATETQLLRKFSNTPLQIQVELLQTVSHSAQNVDRSHLESFYTSFDQIKNKFYDGLVITGAPVENMDFEAMDYWAELDTQMCYKKDAGQIANVERETRGYSDVIAKVDNKMLELRRQIEMM